MTTPIIMSDKLHLSSNYLQQIQHKETLIRPEFKNVELNKENDAFSPQNIRFSNQISIINKQEINDIYNKIKIEVKNKLDKSNTSHAELTPFDHQNSSIDEIMSYPIEVKIEPDEIHTAILYNRMGINFIEVKRVEIRIELLNRAEDDVAKIAKQGAINTEQKQALYQKIKNNILKLENEKHTLLEGDQMKKNQQQLFEKLKFHQG